jgi:hypothetical protein
MLKIIVNTSFIVLFIGNVAITQPVRNTSIWPKSTLRSIELANEIADAYYDFDFTDIRPRNRPVDLSIFLPKIGDQGDGKCCTAFATTWVMKSIMMNMFKKNSKDNPAVINNWQEYVFNPILTYQILISDPTHRRTCGDETDLLNTLVTISRMKGAKISEIGIPNGVDPCQCNLVANDKLKDYIIQSDSFMRIISPRSVDIRTNENLENELISGHPILIEFLIPNGFFELGRNSSWNKLLNPLEYTYNKARHAAVIVGFDRDRRKFKVANSYGSDWGDGGYFYLPYDFLTKNTINSFGNSQNIFGAIYVVEASNASMLDDFRPGDLSNIIHHGTNVGSSFADSITMLLEDGQLRSYFDNLVKVKGIEVSRKRARIAIVNPSSNLVLLNRVVNVGEEIPFDDNTQIVRVKNITQNRYGKYITIDIRKIKDDAFRAAIAEFQSGAAYILKDEFLPRR